MLRANDKFAIVIPACGNLRCCNEYKLYAGLSNLQPLSHALRDSLSCRLEPRRTPGAAGAWSVPLAQDGRVKRVKLIIKAFIMSCIQIDDDSFTEIITLIRDFYPGIKKGITENNEADICGYL